MSSQANSLQLGQENPPHNEDEIIQEVLQISRELLQRDYPAHIRPARRDAHAKHHGCVKAEFIIEPDLPKELRHGVFKEPRTYKAWVRFSNGARHVQDDGKGDSRGMAIKLVGVEGEKLLEAEKHAPTQDFTMANHPVFAVRNAEDYRELLRKRLKGERKVLQFFFPSLNPRQWRLHEFKIVQAVERRKIPSPLEIQYWSMAPYQLGPHAIKFSAKPSAGSYSTGPIPGSPHYLYEAMVKHLSQQEACFDFLVQVQTDPQLMPIEDPTIVWDESRSPYKKVATVRIPVQVFDTPEQMAFCEQLSFTPWHSLPEHRPIGGINRMRKQVYEAMSRMRHEMNQAPYEEPTELEYDHSI